jgi:hypothetical protein
MSDGQFGRERRVECLMHDLTSPQRRLVLAVVGDKRDLDLHFTVVNRHMAPWNLSDEPQSGMASRFPQRRWNPSRPSCVD